MKMSFTSKVDVLELLTSILKEQTEKLEEMVDQIEEDMEEYRYHNECIKFALLSYESRKDICPKCGERMYPTHNIADQRVYLCDDCDIKVPMRIVHCPECEEISPNPFAKYCIYCGAKLTYGE